MNYLPGADICFVINLSQFFFKKSCNTKYNIKLIYLKCLIYARKVCPCYPSCFYIKMTWNFLAHEGRLAPSLVWQAKSALTDWYSIIINTDILAMIWNSSQAVVFVFVFELSQ